MENRADTPVDEQPGGILWPYLLLNGISVCGAIAGVFYLVVGLFAFVSGKSGEGNRALYAGLLFIVTALLLWAICDLGARLRRMEREQRQMRDLLAQQFPKDP